jgi:D-arginine dehydrogenase
MMTFDIAIVGAGMAGASLAAALAPHLQVLLLETEDQAGYHATGRSAAFWTETYGGPLVQPLTSLSGPFLATPPAAFSEKSFLLARGALMLARKDVSHLAHDFLAAFAGSGVRHELLSGESLIARLPGLRPAWDLGVWEPSNADIDVAALHAAFLRAARREGAELALRRPVTELVHHEQGWDIVAGSQRYQAKKLVNAAGAWASEVAALAGASNIAIQPMRRTMVQLRLGCDIPADLPLVVDLEERFYFKPEGARRIWLSPHDETPTAPCDAAPEEEDIARAIARFEEVLNWPIEAVERSWAGLRSFSPDRVPVLGQDPLCPDFYWCAGQGGAGIQTAPAIAALLAAEIRGVAPGAPYDSIDWKVYAPGRFSGSPMA